MKAIWLENNYEIDLFYQHILFRAFKESALDVEYITDLRKEPAQEIIQKIIQSNVIIENSVFTEHDGIIKGSADQLVDILKALELKGVHNKIHLSLSGALIDLLNNGILQAPERLPIFIWHIQNNQVYCLEQSEPYQLRKVIYQDHKFSLSKLLNLNHMMPPKTPEQYRQELFELLDKVPKQIYQEWICSWIEWDEIEDRINNFPDEEFQNSINEIKNLIQNATIQSKINQ